MATLFRRKRIYPSLPSQAFLDDYLLPADILCPGSSDDDDERAAQSKRILSKAERYLRGENPYIQSASLRGPVVKNPWRKLKQQHPAPPPSSPPASSSVMKKEEKLSTYFAAKKGHVSTPRGKENSPPRQPPPSSPPALPPPRASSDLGAEIVSDSTPVGVEVEVRWLGKSKDWRLTTTVMESPSKQKKRKRSVTAMRDLERHHVPSGAVSEPEINWKKKRPRVNFTAEAPAVVTKKVMEERDKDLDGRKNLKVIDKPNTSAPRLPPSEPTSSQMRQTEEIARGVVNSFLEEADKRRKSMISETAVGGDRVMGNGDRIPGDVPRIQDEDVANPSLPPEAPPVSLLPKSPPHQLTASDETPPSPPPPATPPQPHIEPETPWQGTQLQLAAAQKNFFDALADSPIRFDSPQTLPTPNPNSTTNPSKLSTSFMATSSSPAQGEDSMAVWGAVLKTPLPPPLSKALDPFSAREPEKSAPQLPPFPSGSAVAFSSPARPLENLPELTPFAAFSTPPRASPRSPSFRHQVGFSLSSPAPARKSVKFMEFGELDVDSTLEDEPGQESSIPSPDKSLIGMGQQGRQADDDQDLTREVAEIVGSGRWDIDEELRKMAKSRGEKTEDKSGGRRRRRRKTGRKGLWT